MVALVIAMICVVELVRRLPLLRALQAMMRTTNRTARVWAYRRGLEARKERATLLLSGQMFRQSSALLGLILIAVSPIGAVLLADPLTGLEARSALMSWPDRAIVAIVTVTYAYFRFHIVPRLRRG